MSMDLRTISITPLRHTFGHLARRMGADKPASRYFEATMDLQPVENFHYRPTWQPELDIFDTGRTRIVMKDWYALKDPRQYYYGAWVQARGRMQETAEGDFALVDELGLAAAYPDTGRDLALSIFLPLRHAAWGSNLNNAYVSAYSYGIAVSQAACYASMDQLGIAQYLTRLGMAFDAPDALPEARAAWLNDAAWQGLRRYTEDLMVTPDWFEVLLAQNYVLEGLLYPLIYGDFNDYLNGTHGPLFSLLTRFQREWYAESAKWLDGLMKVASAESPANQVQLSAWLHQWLERARTALAPIAERAFGNDGAARLACAVDVFSQRAAKAGLTVLG
jgi:phenol hydroxylase P1 protein